MYHLIIDLDFEEKVQHHPLKNTPFLKLSDSISIPLVPKVFEIMNGIDVIKTVIRQQFECRENMEPTGVLFHVAQHLDIKAKDAARVYWKQLHGICNEITEIITSGYVPTWCEEIQSGNLECVVSFKIVKQGEIVDQFTSDTGFIKLQAAIDASTKAWHDHGLVETSIPLNQENILVFKNKEWMEAFIYTVNLMAPFNKEQFVIRDVNGAMLSTVAFANVPTIYIRAVTLSDDEGIEQLTTSISDVQMPGKVINEGTCLYFNSENKQIPEVIIHLVNTVYDIIAGNHHYGDTYRRYITKDTYPYMRSRAPLISPLSQLWSTVPLSRRF